MFPLNAVIFPGVSVPLTVFEDRYRALVHHLLRVEDPTQRVFGSVGIREGYEVGDHGAQSLYRVGCRARLTEVEAQPDGTFEVVAVCLDRISLHRLDTVLRSHDLEALAAEHGRDNPAQRRAVIGNENGWHGRLL